jgi:hypothetical protein
MLCSTRSGLASLPTGFRAPGGPGASYGRAGQDRRPFSATMELLLFAVLAVSNTFKKKDKASKIVPRGRGVRGARTALSAPPSPQRVSPRGTPEEMDR